MGEQPWIQMICSGRRGPGWSNYARGYWRHYGGVPSVRYRWPMAPWRMRASLRSPRGGPLMKGTRRARRDREYMDMVRDTPPGLSRVRLGSLARRERRRCPSSGQCSTRRTSWLWSRLSAAVASSWALLVAWRRRLVPYLGRRASRRRRPGMWSWRRGSSPRRLWVPPRALPAGVAAVAGVVTALGCGSGILAAGAQGVGLPGVAAPGSRA